MGPIFDAAWISLAVAFVSVVLTIPPALIAATLLYRSRWRVLEVFFLLPLLLPPTVCGFALLMLLSPYRFPGYLLALLDLKVVFTPWGTVLACCVMGFPLAFQACILGLSRVSIEVLESARLLSSSWALNTVRVVWPQLGGALGIAALLVFARSVGEFGASAMVGGNQPGVTQTLPLLIFSATETGRFSQAGWAALVSLTVGIVVYLLLRAAERR